jgi:LysR family transcriptional regulator, transcriptional activator of nhaA
MQWLNYNHLFYFWVVAKEGGITAASKVVRLAPSTISAQISVFESTVGHSLFERRGRRLILTEVGQHTFRVADEMFTLGNDLRAFLEDGTSLSKRLVVGVAMVVPKLVVQHLLPLQHFMGQGIDLVCVEDQPGRLMNQLATGEIDFMISDAPAPVRTRIAAYNHHLGDCSISLFGTSDLIQRYGSGLPASLDHAPFLLPTEHATLRRQLEHYFKRSNVHPKVIAEFQDSALMKVYGQNGFGLFPSPTLISDELCRQYSVQNLTTLPIKEHFYAVTTERRITDEAVASAVSIARAWFAEKSPETD